MRSNFTKYPAGLSASSPVIGFINKPISLLLSVVGAVFVLEVLIMILLMYLPPLTAFQETFLDSTLLSIILFPVLYLLIFRPIRIHIELRRQAEEEKDALIDELRKAIDEVKTLRGIIPICASCKKNQR